MGYEFSFYMPVNILGGKNALEKNKNIFSSLGQRCLMVTGKASAEKSGALGDIKKIFDELGIEYEIFNKGQKIESDFDKEIKRLKRQNG